MGGRCTKQPKDLKYDVFSTKFLDHYSPGETLGRGAFGIVKAAKLKPEAINALSAQTLPTDPTQDPTSAGVNITRRKRFADKPLAVKVMRHQRSAAEGDSCEKVEVQIARIELQIQELEQSMDASNIGQMEELQWLQEYSENLKGKLQDMRQKKVKTTPREMMIREVQLLDKCQHQYIVQMVEMFEDNTAFCVVFERCYGNMISRFPNGVQNEKDVARQACQLLSGVKYLHEKFILHRDIKPENLMFRTPKEDAEVLLGDFGMAVELRKAEDRCQGCAGTPHFVPPEGFHSYYQSFPSDIWACGCTIYWSLLGRLPFEVSQDDLHKNRMKENSKSIRTTALFGMWRSTGMAKVLSGWKPEFHHDQTAMLARKICHPRQGPSFKYESGKMLENQSIIELLAGMLCKNPKDRSGIDATLMHPWLANVNIEVQNSSICWSSERKNSAKKAEAAARGKSPKLDQVLPVSED